MKLTIIGCHGAYPVKNGATSGYLLEEGDTRVLLDCGSGVLSRLQNIIDLKELDGVILTHYHPDHCADLGCLQYAVMLDVLTGRRRKGFAAWGPGNVEKLSYEQYCQGYSYEKQPHFQIGELEFEVLLNQHEIPSYAIKARGKSKCKSESIPGVKSKDKSECKSECKSEYNSEGVLVYSGDTNYYDGLAEFAGKADLLLCEASLYARQKGDVWGHMCSTEAGELAARAEVSGLCLTHFPHYGEIPDLQLEAEKVYHGNIILAEPGMSLYIPTNSKPMKPIDQIVR